MEDLAGVRHYLFCVGLDLPGHPRRSARGSPTPSRQHAFFHGWNRALCVDAPEGYSVAVPSRVGRGFASGGLHLRCRLRSVVLGRTARAFRSRRGHAGDDPGLHGSFGDSFSGDAAAYRPPRSGPFSRDRRRRHSGEPVTEPGSGRSTHRSRGSSCPGDCCHKLVSRLGSYPQAAVTCFKSDELGSADARWRNHACWRR